tara:strand:+ start:3381 stop:4535 length:1155 start_codon:yes stop_codon:yes gene_type:complete
VLKKKICFIGTSRATYGYKKNILKLLENENKIKTYYIVTGMHLSKQHGYSINEIIKDKISIYKKFNMLSNNKDDHLSFVKTLSKEMEKFSEILNKIKPDILVVTGDRAEMFIAAVTAVYMGIPVAHIQAGDLSGHIDGSVRHAITKISHIHLASCKDSADRVFKMGEQKWRIFNVGAPQLDELVKLKKIKNKKLLNKFNINENENFFLIIFHPVLYDIKSASAQINLILKSLEKYNFKKVLIYPNIDTGNSKIIKIIQKFKRKKNYEIVKNLNRGNFLTLLKYASILIGNSSSGILEAPTFKTPVLNIGNRQRGRIQANNIVNTDFKETKIIQSINYILNNKKFKNNLNKCRNPYGNGSSSKKIIKILKNIKLNQKLLDKEMTY